MNQALMACNSAWLDQVQTTLTTTNGAAGGGAASNTTDYYCQSFQTVYWPYYYPVYQTSPARPIKLTLSEVERLRKAAKADDKLKAILSKFTGQIEITVDFD